ncbi:MAG: DUF3592 domain-containing protein [Halieaceae bacterium]|jgi:hypothetical protein|nr:DUF3592 domain-containing protein [Halieaceae bacterium]
MEILIYLKEMIRLAAAGEVQGVFFWASVYASAACFYSLYFQLQTRRWPWTEGKLVRVNATKFGDTERERSDQDYIGKALYTFLVSGQQYEGERISPWMFVVSHNARFVLAKQIAGIHKTSVDGVRVYYNPADPRKSYLIVAGTLGIAVTLLLGSLPFIFYWMKYHA